MHCVQECGQTWVSRCSLSTSQPRLRIMMGAFAGMIAMVMLSGSAQAADAAASAKERGKYLVHHVAMCIQCHTPRDAAGNLKTQELLAGAPMPVKSPYPNETWGFQAPNLRGLPARWGGKEFVVFLKTGKTPNGSIPRSPMPPFRMTDEDAQAIAAYLNSVTSE